MTDSLVRLSNDQQETAAPHRIARVRHDLRFRVLTVARVANVTPKMRRITLTGEDLAGFTSSGFDDHVKLFFPRDGETEPTVPTLGPDGRVLVDESARPIARDYTPRRFDAAANELDIDFAIHEAGPATRWALTAKKGDRIGVGGPRGSFVISDDFDWYLFVGDETALPAIGRRLEELRVGARAIVLAEVEGMAERQIFDSAAFVTTIWLHRDAGQPGTTTLMDDALRGLELSDGDGFVWVACEIETAKRLRRILVEHHRHPKVWLKAAGYWKRGAANVHASIDD